MSSPVNLENVSAMGSQFNTNVFKDIASKARSAGVKQSKLTNTPVSPAPLRPKHIPEALPTTPAYGLSPNAVAAGRERRRAATPRGAAYASSVKALPVGNTRAPEGGFAPPYNRPAAQPVAFSHAADSPMNATQFKPSTRPFSPPPAQSNFPPTTRTSLMQRRVNRANNQQPSAPMNAPKPSTKPFEAPQVNKIHNITSLPPRPTQPTTVPSTTSPSQFSGTKGGFPQHVPPAGSSIQPLPRLTAAQSEPGKPNEFVVGSRNAKPGGIAAMGSQLEAWAQRRQSEIRAQRKTPPTA